MFVLFLTFLFSWLTGCASEPVVQPQELTPVELTDSVAPESVTTYTFMVEVDPSTMEPTITLPNGTITHSYDEYEQAVYRIHAADPSATFAIDLGSGFSKMIGADLGEVFEVDTAVPPPPWYKTVSGYTLSGGSGYGYVSGCIKRTGNYYALRLRSSTSLLFDVHFAAYTSGGRLCVGIYESVYGYINWCSCTPTYSDISDAIYAVAIAAGLSSAVAYVISSVGTPLVVVFVGI